MGKYLDVDFILTFSDKESAEKYMFSDVVAKEHAGKKLDGVNIICETDGVIDIHAYTDDCFPHTAFKAFVESVKPFGAKTVACKCEDPGAGIFGRFNWDGEEMYSQFVDKDTLKRLDGDEDFDFHALEEILDAAPKVAIT